jgi:hypothetical protein
LKLTIATAAALLCVLMTSLVGTARASTSFGVVESSSKGADGGVLFFSTLTDLGMTENQVVVSWDPKNPDTIQGQADLDYWLPQAALAGINITFAVVPAHAGDLSATRLAPAQFAAYLRLLAKTYPQVKSYVVGNEPNLNFFWRPQYKGKKPIAAAAYEKLLAKSYDALKSVDPSIDVLGVGLSPRGNDNPRAASNVSRSPVRFIRELGLAYRASKRTKPIMDELAFHPYPRQNTDPLAAGYLWPNAGLSNLDRVKQALWDAFNGTGQPTVAESASSDDNGLTLNLGEIGWQVSVPSSAKDAYFGRETVRTISEAKQAKIYSDVVYKMSCDPAVSSVNFFHLADEANLDRWQSGLMRADGTKRPSYGAVKAAIADTHGDCSGVLTSWRHAVSVIGARVRFGRAVPVSPRRLRWGFAVSVREDAGFRAALLRVTGSQQAAVRTATIGRALARGRVAGALLATKGAAAANHTMNVKFRNRRLSPGTYVYAIRLTAAMNPKRASVFVSRPFVVRSSVRR